MHGTHFEVCQDCASWPLGFLITWFLRTWFLRTKPLFLSDWQENRVPETLNSGPCFPLTQLLLPSDRLGARVSDSSVLWTLAPKDVASPCVSMAEGPKKATLYCLLADYARGHRYPRSRSAPPCHVHPVSPGASPHKGQYVSRSKPLMSQGSLPKRLCRRLAPFSSQLFGRHTIELQARPSL